MNNFNYSRRKTIEVHIGSTPLGADHPIRVQSMTNTSTQETDASVQQAIRIVDAGGEYVRLTTQGVKEAKNLRSINEQLRKKGYTVPLVADVHFNPKVADVAARYAEKVRINPGNYVDAARTFKELEYTDAEYAQELTKIRDRFVPFLTICKTYHTAVRMGVNHGSLSDRIMSRYGDTPEGMVESCMEFLRICVEQRFMDVVISIKASNTVVMVKTVRLLVHVMEKEGMTFPLHLGVTEAGDGEDGRIKSALGIGALLTDGLGDTIRVSLSEEPEYEIPVARKLVEHIRKRQYDEHVQAKVAPSFDYLSLTRRTTQPVKNIGGNHVPVVIAWGTQGFESYSSQFMPDYLMTAAVCQNQTNSYPVFTAATFDNLLTAAAEMKFLLTSYSELTDRIVDELHRRADVVVVSTDGLTNRIGAHRALVHRLLAAECLTPVVILQHYNIQEVEDLQIAASADVSALLFDGFCDGICLVNDASMDSVTWVNTTFGILQAGRTRTTKTEYISCPGCGRTLFDLQKTIGVVKEATSHLKNLKIGIMGCIVNGPGEMADADYGYVGAGRGKISLYKKKECIERNIPEEEAVSRLIDLIKSNGDYVEVE